MSVETTILNYINIVDYGSICNFTSRYLLSLLDSMSSDNVDIEWMNHKRDEIIDILDIISDDLSNDIKVFLEINNILTEGLKNSVERDIYKLMKKQMS